jgi:hypothetical protein
MPPDPESTSKPLTIGPAGLESTPIETAVNPHLHEIFVETADSVHRYVPIHRAVLVAVMSHYRDLLAIARWSEGESDGSRILSLHLPVENSLFAQVAAQRFEFGDDYFGLFSGNSIERQLLLDGVTGGSYMIYPIKIDASLVGLIGFSSFLPGAFGDLESLDPDRTFAPLAAELGRLRREQHL